MILFFINHRKVHIALGLPSPESPRKINIAAITRIQARDNKKQIHQIVRQLTIERPRPGVPFQADGIWADLVRPTAGSDLHVSRFHTAFAIFRTNKSFVMRGLNPLPTGGWAECNSYGYSYEFYPETTAEKVAEFAANRIRHAVRWQRKFLAETASG